MSLRAYPARVLKACRRRRLTWQYLLNAGPSLGYAMRPRRLAPEAYRIVRDLNRNGIAISSVDALGVEAALFEGVSLEVDNLERASAEELADARRLASSSVEIGSKTFNVELLGSIPALDTQSVFCRLALDRSMLDVANAYFGMFTRLRYFNVWRTFATPGRPRESQLWHQDREDFHIMKVFIYLGDVGRGAGPFTYAPGTHPKGSVSREPRHTLEGGVRRSTDEQMAAVVPPARWIEALGSRGTVIFADTRGYHKGGLARDRDRLMFTCMFTSRASQSKELFDRSRPLPPLTDPAMAFAVRQAL